MRLFSAFFFLAVCGMLAAGEPNAIINGDFKLGSAGFGVWRLVRSDLNPKLENLPLSVEDGRLVLRNPYGEYFQLRSAEFNLPAHTTARFHTQFEGPSGKLSFCILRITPAGKWLIHRRDIRANGKSQKVEITFDTAENGGAYMLLVYSPEKRTPAGIYRFSSFRLNAGNAFGDIHAAVAVDKPLFTLGEEKTAKIKVSLNNSSDQNASGILDFCVRDPLLDIELYRAKLPLVLKTGTSIREFQIPLKRFGTFTTRIRWNEKEIPSLRCLFSIIGKYQGKEFADPANEFVIGVNRALAYKKHGDAQGLALCNGETLDTRYEQLQKMGCRVLRDWDGGMLSINWAVLEPQEGKFDFTYFDLAVDTARRHGILVMPVLGRMFENFYKTALPLRPAWLQPKLIRKATPKGSASRYIVNVPPQEIWKRYIGAIAEHAGKRVVLYEIMNEPNLHMSPELYLEYLASASETIREKAPHATILGICATGDQGGELLKFMIPCIKLGAQKYLDGISFHPYNARTLGSLFPADRQIQELRAIAGKTPVWNGEMYYLYDWEKPSDDADQTKYTKAFHLAQRFLVDLGEGVKQSWTVHGDQLWTDIYHEEFIRSYQTAPVPNGLFAAANALARYFEGAKPLYKKKMTNGAVIYGFRGKNGAPVAALWNRGGHKGLFADLRGFVVSDLYGNPVEAGKSMELTDCPLYLRMPGVQPDEFVRKLETLPVRLPSPFLPSDVVRVAGNRAYLTLFNITDREISSTAGIHLPGSVSAETVPFRIPANGEISLVFPLMPGSLDAKPELRAFCDNRIIRFPLQILRNPVLHPGEKISLGEKDFRAEFTVTRTADSLRIHADVTDATDSGAALNGKEIWDVDGIELFFDMLPNILQQRHSKLYRDTTFRLFLNPRLPEAEQLTAWCGKSYLNGVRIPYRVSRTRNGYSADLEIPLNGFRNSDTLGFGIKINDRTVSGKVRSLRWGVGEKAHNNRLQFGLIEKGTAK